MLHQFFRRFARAVSSAIGHPLAFVMASLVVVGWAVSGPFLGFSERWQLIINTLTTIVTFLVVFIIQNSQNRDSKALHLKLDELIRVTKAARNELVDIEDKEDEELDRLQKEFTHLDDIQASNDEVKRRRSPRPRRS